MAKHPSGSQTGHVGTRLTALLSVSIIAGLLMAGVFLPLVGGVGLAAKRTADSFNNLPSELQVPRLPQVSKIVATDGSPLATLFYENRVAVSLAAVPKPMQQAVVAIEDARFYTHHGVDFHGLARAAVNNAKGGDTQGGSTLTQQYVKNALIEGATTEQQRKDATAQTIGRKVREARYALALERIWSKQKILENYLNIAYFGQGAYGVGTAAQHYFGKPVQQLSVPQAALLAGIIRNPSAYDPSRHPQAATIRRNEVLERMVEQQYLTAAQAAAYERAPLGLNVKRTDNGCVTSFAPFFCDYVISQVKQDPGLGATPQDRLNLLLRGGLTIKTTIDPAMQASALQALDARVGPNGDVAGAIDMVEPGTGYVKAMAVSKPYGTDKSKGQVTLNYAIGGSSGFQSGSTFKVFTLAAALQRGIDTHLTLNAPPHYYSRKWPGSHPFPYEVDNAGDGEQCDCDMVAATWESVNTYFIQLEERTGIEAPARIAESMGVRLLPGNKPLLQVPSLTLGTNEVSPLAMAGAYAAFAARGNFCEPTAIASVTDYTGHRYKAGGTHCRQVLDPAVADKVTSILRGVIDGGHAKTGGNAAIGRPAAGKTGTVQDYAAAWFVGYTPQLATAVWVGDPRGGYKYPLRGVRIDGRYYSQVFGGTLPAPIWASAMRSALAGQPWLNFANSPMAVSSTGNGAKPKAPRSTGRRVPNVAGMRPADAIQALSGAGFTGVFSGTLVPGGLAGRVAYTSPGAGTRLAPGSTVTIFLGGGAAVATPPAPKPPPSAAPRPKPTPRHSPKATPKR